MRIFVEVALDIDPKKGVTAKEVVDEVDYDFKLDPELGKILDMEITGYSEDEHEFQR